jgi:DNA-directed RNA polymerase subunit RPC12/RpoP
MPEEPKKAYVENLSMLLSVSELVPLVESLKDAQDQYQQRQKDKESAAKLLSEVEQRCAAIKQSDTRRAAIAEAAEAKKQELTRHFISLVDAAREHVRQAVHQDSPLDASKVPIAIDGVSEALEASYLKIKQAEAELAADAERKPRARIVEKCPKCGQKSYELYDTKTIDYSEDIRSRWHHPEGFTVNYPIRNGVRVQMLHGIWTKQDYFRCPKCSHSGEGKPYEEVYAK